MEKSDNVNRKVYSSNAHSKYQKIIKYYKAHPIKYMRMIQDSLDIKLTFIQKTLLYLYHIGILKTDYQKQQDNINKILKKYMRKW